MMKREIKNVRFAGAIWEKENIKNYSDEDNDFLISKVERFFKTIKISNILFYHIILTRETYLETFKEIKHLTKIKVDITHQAELENNLITEDERYESYDIRLTNEEIEIIAKEILNTYK